MLHARINCKTHLDFRNADCRGVKEASVGTEEIHDIILPEQKESGLLTSVILVFKDKILFSFVAPAQSNTMLIQIFN